MVQLFVYWQDLETTPLVAVESNNDGLSPGDVMELLEMLVGGAGSSSDPERPGLLSSSSSNASNSGRPPAHHCGVILHTMDVTPGQQSNKWHEVFLAAGS